MRERIIITVCLIAMFVMGFFLGRNIAPENAGFYPRHGVVIDREIDDEIVVVVEDDAGFLWAFCAEDIFVGEHVAMLMDDMGTLEITDDAVVGIA